MYLLCYLLLSVLLRKCECAVSLRLVGMAGQNITLPCRYNSLAYSNPNMCWGRGLVPRSKCTSTILSTQDGEVTYRASPRYMLSSGVREGGVSLTILHALESDTGVYGCRVEIPGWFNDLKYNRQLLIVQAGNTDDSVSDLITIKEQERLIYLIENTGRIAVLIFIPLVAIIVFILRRRKSHALEGTPGHEENVYDDIHHPPVRTISAACLTEQR